MQNATEISELLKKRGLTYEEWLSVVERAVINFAKLPAHLSLKDTLPFGKYAGAEVESVCRADPAWIFWLLRQPVSYFFQPEVGDLVESIKKDILGPRAPQDD